MESQGSFSMDLTDPRAPAQDEWDRMTPGERERVVSSLPIRPPADQQAPDECRHLNTGITARQALDVFFKRTGRDIYVSSGLNVYYPGEPRFAPDVLAVLDVERRQRLRWVVSQEGKGRDLVIELHIEGHQERDRRRNRERYAALGIQEYFLFDCTDLRLEGHRLAGGSAVYEAIAPEEGRIRSEVLGLDLALDGPKLRFLHGSDTIPDAEELIEKLGNMVNALSTRHRSEVNRAAAQAARFHKASQLAEAAGLKVAELERDLAALRSQVDRTKRGS